ncbi:hypothetical protein SD70_11080 [Gordoniibacillus kamchatkensis]|uniref:Uncharacterized protein n=1 Tax=Gordoniibacillus kamchatkensis TaxID=1590651 RepID=A0ABR5AIA9_9BACL|nr:LOG family protein [Paenibacillus sp. VKM B-2647]KIL40784.1 hypothetical protein SD70_11080 [Paenibacillus sp. VKM B-2647]
MNRIQLRGTIIYEPSEDRWRGSGTDWWIEHTMAATAKITFEEPITFDPFDPMQTKSYSLTVSNIQGNGDAVTYNVDETGFVVTWKHYKPSVCMASFVVSGVRASYVPNDRTLSNEDSVADVYAAGILFDYEAKYGVITVMGSASISSKSAVKSKRQIVGEHASGCKQRMEGETDAFSKQLLEKRLAKIEHRLARHQNIEDRSTAYWNSAKKFGELWGYYSAHEQKEALGGCYVPLCTGGGPGIMQAAAEGARSQHAHVIGIDCQFGLDDLFDLRDSYSVYSNQRLRLNNFSIREGVLINYSHVVLFWPGGYGTAWEVFELLSKISTGHLRRRRTKAIFVHREFWQPLFAFVDHMRLHGTVNSYGDRIKIPGVDDQFPDDAYIAEVVDTPEEAFAVTRAFVEELYRKNQLTLRE